MILPTDKKKLLQTVMDVKAACRNSAGRRAALARQQNLWIETGRATGSRSLVNRLYAHNDRLAAHLFSPSELNFSVDFEAHYPDDILAKGAMAARKVNQEWERKGIDMQFGAATQASLAYGAAIVKQIWGWNGPDSRLIMPWQFGVYREDENNLEDQEAMCESGLMTLPEVWRRISHLPDAEKLFNTVRAHASKDNGQDLTGSFFHQVLSTATLNTSLDDIRQQPGGVVQLAGNGSMSVVTPTVDIDMVAYHELWINDEDTGDYTTVLLLEPDIIVSPYYKRENMFAPQTQPYTLVQANYQAGNFWGRSEIVDLMEPQGLLSDWMDDIKRLMGVQFDKILAFPGGEGITDEAYGDFRNSGYIGLAAGADVKDLTPKLPQEAFAAVDMLNRFFDQISGFDNILSGQGQVGVRSGMQTDALMRTASPRLRDRSLLIERQCAIAGDKTLRLLQAKDAQAYFADPTSGARAEFLLHDLPDDARITVDSHSSSPIFASDHANLISFGLKAGFVDGEYAIDNLPFSHKDVLKQRYAAKQAAQAKFAQEHPEAVAEAAKKKR